MGVKADKLTSLVEAKDRHDIPWTDVLPQQIEAANERLNERLGTTKLLANRAETAGIKKIRTPADLIPLLFAHTAYKSYPESWFTQGKWDRMGQWLDTVTTQRVRGVNNENVNGIDEWLERLADVGLYVSCSSGTTGKCSMLPASMVDRTFGKRSVINSFTWATGIEPKQQYKLFGLTPIARSFKNNDTTAALVDNFCHTRRPFPGDPITVGGVTKMVALRRSIADGTARPAEIAEFEATAAKREKALEDALVSTAEAIVASRGERLMFTGFVVTMFRVAELVQKMGYSGKDFAENAIMTGGGLKGAKLPADYQEQIFNTFNLAQRRSFQLYSMQEINTQMPRCAAGRYHVPPWLMLLVLNQEGDQLIEPTTGEIEGRAGFFDLALDGRWCGVISGDKVRVDYGKCACGHQGPTVANEILRYSDLPGGDKISCSGTIDAYIRGAA